MHRAGFSYELNECSIASPGRGMVGLAVPEPGVLTPRSSTQEGRESVRRTLAIGFTVVTTGLSLVGGASAQTGQLEGAGGIAVAADGSQVFVSGSLNSFGFPGLFFGNGFKALGRDPASGRLSDQGGFFQSGGGLLSPPLAVSPDAASFYWPLGGGPGSGSLASARRVAGGFGLQGVVQQNLAGMVHALVVSADAKNVYLTNSMDDSLLAFQRDPSTGALTFQASFTDGIGGVDGLRGASGLAISPDGEFVYVGGSQESPAEIAIFSRDTSTGALAFADVEAMPGFGSPGSIALSPNGQRLYAGQGGFVVFARDGADGSLAALPDSFVPSGFGFSFGAQTLLPVEDGVVYTLVASEHALWQVPTTSTGVDGAAATVYEGIREMRAPKGLAASPDGAHIYVTAQELGTTAGTVVAFARDADNDDLTFVSATKPRHPLPLPPPPTPLPPSAPSPRSAPPPPPPAGDSAAPRAGATLGRTPPLGAALMRGLRVKVTSNEATEFKARAELSRRVARRLRLGSARVVVARGAADLPKAGRTTLVLRFIRRAKRRLLRAQQVKLALVIAAQDRSDNTATLRRSVTLKR